MTVRILHCYKVYPPDHTGGVEEAIARVVAGAPADAESSLLVCRTRGIGSTLTVDGLPVERTTSFGQISSMPISPSYLWRFRQRARDADVIAFHAPFPLVDVAVKFGLEPRHALVVHWHGEIVGRKPVRPIVEPIIHSTLQRADRILITNETMIDPSPFLGAVRHKCRVAPYGIDTGWWTELAPADRDAVADLRKKHPRLVVGCGRLVSYKGFDVLIRAMARVNGHLIIIGTGPLEQSLRDLCRELNLTGRITFAGFVTREEQRRLFNAANVFVLSSVTVAEGFGIAQVEAMSCGRPVVNTNLPSTVPLVARHQQEGLTAEPADVDGLAAAINRLLDNPDLAVRLGQASQVRARTNYDWRGYAARVMDVYREAIAERPAGLTSRDAIGGGEAPVGRSDRIESRLQQTRQ